MTTETAVAAPQAAPVSTPESTPVAPEATPQSSAPSETASNEAPSGGKSLGDIIDAAFDKVGVPNGPSQDRDERGRFKPAQGEPAAAEKPKAEVKPAVEKTVEPSKPATSVIEPPSRFSPDAKAAWETAPEPVKAEVNRAIKELETGIGEYKSKWEPLKDYAAIAEKAGTSLEAALKTYGELDWKLKNEPLVGLEEVFRYSGIDPRKYAQHILGQPAEAQPQEAQIINELRSEIAALKEQVLHTNSTIAQSQEAQQLEEINKWAADKPRFEELAETMGSLVKSGLADTLDDAYEMAGRLKPAPVQAAPQPAPTPTAQPLRSNPSVRGSPTSGSNPARMQLSKSPREAVDNAFATLGL